MSKTLAVGLVIGASLASSVGQSISGVGDKLSQLQKKSEGLKVGAAIGRDFQNLRSEFVKTALESAKAGGKNEELKRKLTSLGTATANAKREAERYGFTIGKVAQQTKYLETASSQAEARIGRMQARMERQQARGQMRGELKSTMLVGAAIFTYPVKKIMDFEQSMAEVGAITRASAEDMKKLEFNAKEMGRTTQFTASQAAGAQKYLGMAGFNTNQIITAMPGMLNLAAAGNLDLAEAADIASNVLSGFRLKQEESARVADVLTLAANSSNTSVQQMGQAMKFVAPDARALGFSIEETASVISKLSDSGIQGEMAGTTMRGMLNSLIDPSKNAAGFMDFLGVKTMNAKGEMRDLPSILKDLDTAMTKKGFGSGEKARGMQTIFSARAGTGAQALIDSVLSGELNKLTGTYKEAGGAAGEAANKMNDTMKGDLLKLGSAIESVALSFKGSFEPAIRPAIQGATEFITSASQFIQANPKIAQAIVGLAAGVIGLKAASIVGRIGISHLMDGFSLLNGGFQMLRPSTIQAGIGLLKMKGIGGIVTSITTPLKLFKSGALKDFGAIKSGIKMIGKGLLAPFKFIGVGLKAVGASMMANPVVWIIGAIVVAIVVAGYLIYKNWGRVRNFLCALWIGIKQKWEAAKKIFTGWWDSIKTGWNTIGDAIKAPFVVAFEWIGTKMEWLKGKWDGLKSVFSSGASATPGGNSAMGFSTTQLSLPGHATGGIFNKEHVARFSEGGKKEAAIPLEGNKSNARSIWAASGRALGMLPRGSSQSESGGNVSIEKGAIVINAAPGMDVGALASEVMRRIEQKMGQKQRRSFSDATFAG